MDKDRFSDNNEQLNIICGRNPVMEAIRGGREIDRVLIAHGLNSGSIPAIKAKCRERSILIKEVSPAKLDALCNGANHQGIAITFASKEYSSVEDILSRAEQAGHAPFIIICDGIEDPHNLGAIIRTAECCGADGIIIPERRSASLNATVAKSASGALEYIPVARVTNLATTIDSLKEKGLWIYGADMDGADYRSTDLSGATAIVIGNEGKGISTLVLKKCDAVISLPMFGKINSLNASVAAGVLMYEVVHQRNKA